MSLLKKLASHRFTKQAFTVMLYMGLSRLVTFGGTVYMQNCLGDRKLGVSTFILATMGQILLFITCSLDTLFIRRYKGAKTEEERNHWVELATSQRFFSAVALGLAAILIAWFLHLERSWWLGIMAAFPLLILSAILPAWINVAQEDMPANFKAATYAGIVMALIYFAFFRRGQATGSDIVVALAGMVIQVAFQMKAALKRVWPLPIRWQKMEDFWSLLHEGRWLFVTGLMIYVYVTLEVPMLKYLSSLEECGRYGVAKKLADSAQQVLVLVPLLLFPKFVEWQRQGAAVLWQKQLRAAGILAVVCAPMCIVVFAVSPFLFRKFYRPDLAIVAVPFAVLFASKVVVVFNGLFAQGLWAQSEDKQVFWVVLPTAIVSFVCNYLLLPKYGMMAACCVNLLSEILVLAGCFILARRHVKRSTLAAAPAVPVPGTA